MAPAATKQGGELRILCIDGGGIRGLIPAKILESELQVVLEAVLLFVKYYDGSNETLRSLHDMVALGVALEAMLRPILDALLAKGRAPAAATANGGGLQLVAAHDPVNNGVESEASATTEDYIQEHAGAILQALCHVQGLALDSSFQDGIKEFAEGLRKTLLNPDFVRYALLRPKYDGEGLRKVVKEKLGDHRLQETVTNVVVPTFDIKRNQPVILSTSQARKDQVMDPCLSDICIAATAAPTFFPAHNFKTLSLWPLNWEEFNLIDAGVFANNW